MTDLIQFPLNVLDTRSAYLDTNGKPLANGRLVIYKDNTSTALADVYSDINLRNPEKNPVYLDSSGRTGTGLYTGKPVFVSVERLFGKSNTGDDIYVQIYGFETHSGLEINAFLNSNYVKDRTELKNVENQNPTWVLNEGNPHLYRFEKESLDTYDGIIRVESLAFPGNHWYWETKEIYADQAGISNKGFTHDANAWTKLAKLSMDNNYKIIIPAGYYNFGGKAMPGTKFNDLEIHSGVEFKEFKSWTIAIESSVECLSPLDIYWNKLPSSKIYNRNVFKNIADNIIEKINTISDSAIRLVSGTVRIIRLLVDEINSEKIKSEQGTITNLNIEKNLDVNGTLSAKTGTFEELSIETTKISDNLSAKELEVKSMLMFGSQSIKTTNANPTAISVVPIDRDEALLENVNFASGPIVRAYFNIHFPVGSYLTAYRQNARESINKEYYLAKQSGTVSNHHLIMTNNINYAIAEDIKFRGCGIVGYTRVQDNANPESNPYEGYILVRRVS